MSQYYIKKQNKEKNDIPHNINNFGDIINKIKILNESMNKKEDDIKELINEKDDIIQEIKNKLLTQEKELTKYQNEIMKLNELIGKINKENLKKDKEFKKMKNKLLNQEKIINYYKKKLNGHGEKINKLKIGQNEYQRLKDELILKIEEQKNRNDEILHKMENNMKNSLNDMKRFNMNNYDGSQQNYNLDFTPKKNVYFKSLEGNIQLINSDYGTTLNEIFIKYIKRITKSENINNDDFYFIFNGKICSFWDNTKIEEFFKNCLNPTIIVHNRKK